MTHLEALLIIADTETDIASMKSDLRKEKAKINNFLKFSNNILDVGHSPLALNQGLFISYVYKLLCVIAGIKIVFILTNEF